jgi:hypothetical protein
MSDLTALIARADYALGLEDHLWTDWRALVIDLRDALTAAEAQRRTVEQERDKARRFIEGRGYRRCDIAACNCHSYHGGHAEGLA